MKAMVLTGIRQMEMRNVPEAVIMNPLDVRIRMSAVGICGSDIHYYTRGNIGSQKVTYPFTVGHEGAGVVIETGAGVKNVKQGDSVAIEPAISCNECDQCRAGRHNTCRKLKFLGCPGQAEGCLSEYIIIPEQCCFKIPGKLSYDHGSISEPLAIGIYSVKRSGNIKGLKAGVMGFGPIGMSVHLAARDQGAGDIYVTDKIDERLSIAMNEGAAYTGNPMKENIVETIRDKEPFGLDVVFECCGQQEALDQAIDILKPGGKLMVVGIPEFDFWSVNVEKTRRREISILFVRRQENCTGTALKMMNNGRLDVSRMVTHRFPFGQTKDAFDLVADYKDGVMKAMIYF
ncbi:MAG: alcohol dehydrogenase catalytic domain-containing protein [Bacteroidales bacterium]|nr:alcohol dehydrogenase catalytic domain-containing protein [Bacteroidales bacterium]